MVDKKTAGEHLTGLMNLQYFPATKSAQSELAKAAMEADSVTILKAAVDKWIRDHPEAPKPAELRAVIGELNSQTRQTVRHCEICQGSRYITRWFLVTFHGQSLTAKKSEWLENVTTNEQFMEFARKFEALDKLPNADRQEVRSAAVLCSCARAV